MNVWAIAVNTFREAVRDKILYVLAVFGLILIFVSRAVGWISYGGELKIMTDLGLAAIWLFVALISIFIGTQMIYKEIDKRTLYTILSRPIRRWEFLLGKYCGLLLTSLVILAALSAVFLAYLKLMGAPVTGAILQALFLIFCEMMLVTALAIFFSSASTPVLSAVFTFMIFGVGQLTKWIVDLGNLIQDQAPGMKLALKLFYFLMPNLDNFNVRAQAVHAAARGSGWAIPPEQMLSIVVYGGAYTAAVLLAAALVFRRRNF
ncbi:MAG: ABC transporter permease [Planctomycetota bacterium]|nr:ABC transporter permease [Planctomycetota bacterium]